MDLKNQFIFMDLIILDGLWENDFKAQTIPMEVSIRAIILSQKVTLG